MSDGLSVLPLRGIPEVRDGDDLPALDAAARRARARATSWW